MVDLRHPDPLVDLLRATSAEREIEQAIDRLRLLRRKRRRLVVVITNTPTRLPVDHVIQYNDLIGDRVMRAFGRSGRRPLVLRPDLLSAAAPDLWSSAKAAEHSILRFNCAERWHVRLWEFRVAGQRGPKPGRVLASAADSAEAVAAAVAHAVGALVTGICPHPVGKPL